MTIRPIFSPSARVKECSPLRVGFAAGAGPIVSARVLSDSEGGATAATNDFGKAGIGTRLGETFADNSSRPKEGARGISRLTVLAVESGGAVAVAADAPVAVTAGTGVADADAEADGFAFALAVEFVAAA